jgi:uncharacterized protein YuzE
VLLTYDNESDALYVSLRDGVSVARTEQIDPGTLVDVDRSGEIVGIEVLRPARAWPLDEVVSRFHVSDHDALLLRSVFERSAPNERRYPFSRPARVKAS